MEENKDHLLGALYLVIQNLESSAMRARRLNADDIVVRQLDGAALTLRAAARNLTQTLDGP